MSVPNYENGISFTAAGATASKIVKYAFPVEEIKADITLSPENSGTLYQVTIAADDVDITLPDPCNGVNYKFVVKSNATTNVCNIVAPAAILKGTIVGLNTDGGNATICNNVAGTTITFTAASLKGDLIYLFSDGTNYYVEAKSTGPGADATHSGIIIA